MKRLLVIFLLPLLASAQSTTVSLATVQAGPVTGGSGAGGATSVSNADGTLTISPTTGAVIASLNLAHANTWLAAQTFTNSDFLLLGSSTGATTFASANAGASNFTLTFPAITDTAVTLTAAQTLANKTLTSPAISGPTFTGTFTITPFSTAGILTNNSSGVIASLSNASSASSVLLGLLGNGTPSSTTALFGDGTWKVPSGSSSGANPTASIGASAVNGSATTFMRSDAAPSLGLDSTLHFTSTNLGINLATANNWTGLQTVSITDTSGTGNAHYGLAVVPTLSQSGTAGFTGFLVNETGTTGSGNQYLMDLQTGGSTELHVGLDGSIVSIGSITLSQTGGIIGTTTNNNANAGSVGQTISATTSSASAVTLTTGVVANVATITLTAGDWEIYSVVTYTGSVTGTGVESTVSATSATNGSFPFMNNNIFTSTAANDITYVIPTGRVSLSGSQQYWLTGEAIFSVGTEKAYGYIEARRIR